MKKNNLMTNRRAQVAFFVWAALVAVVSAFSAVAQDPGAPVVDPNAPPVQSYQSQISVTPMIADKIFTAIPAAMNVGSGSDGSGLDHLITEQLKLDLAMSGYFDLIPPETFGIVDLSKDGQTASTIDFNGWLTVGANWLIKSSYEVQGGGKVKLDIKVFDVDTGKQVKIKGWEPKVVGEGNYRYAVHEFVNALIGYKTDGPPGPFGSVMLFSGSDTGNNRKIFALELGGKGAGSQDIQRNINVMPTWGPKGNIYYNAFLENGKELRLFDRETKTATTVIADAYGSDYCPSKDLLAFALDGDLYTMHSDGSDKTQLTFSEGIIDVSPSWGPGCSELAFVSNRDDGVHPQIFVMRRDGSNQRRITHLGDYNTSPEWSPNIRDASGAGSWIAFTARDEFAKFDIFITRPDGSETYRITQDQGDNEEPSWSPDGRYLVFQSNRDGSKEPRLYMARMDVKGSFQTRVSDGFGFRTPTWQP